MHNLWRDARIGLRLLRRQPAFTAVAVLTIALGIAANTAIFSVIYATFFEPLPYRDADRLVMVWSRLEKDALVDRQQVTAREFLEWKRQASVFDDLNAWSWRSTTVSAGGARPELVQIGPATPGFLAMLGYGHPLALGRSFLEEEGTPGRNRVAVVSHRFWRQRLGSDPQVIGRELRIDRQPYTIVGVLGAGPADENQNQVWVPLAFTPEELSSEAPRLLVMGRLKPGVTIQQANAGMEAISRGVAATLRSRSADWRASVEPFRNNFLSADTKRGLWLLLGAVAFVLLIACANVANLLLARGAARQRELAVRTSLGASRPEIVRQLLVESMVIAVVGGAVGVALAAVVLDVVVALMPRYMLPTEAHVRLNVPVLIFTLAACAISGMLFGSAPAWQAARANVNDVLKETGRALTRGGVRVRRVLVAVEFALALTLLAGGGLAIHSLFTLTNRPFGFRTENVLTFGLPIDERRFSERQEIALFYQNLLDRLHALPGVLSAAASTSIPAYGARGNIRFAVAGTAINDAARWPTAAFNIVTPAYFTTYGIPVTQGRVFIEQDRAGAVPVVLVNETFVRRHLASVNPLGQHLVMHQPIFGPTTGPQLEWEIVGVYADTRSTNANDEPTAEIALQFWQSPSLYATLAIHTTVDPASLERSVAAVVETFDADLPVAYPRTIQEILSDARVADRFNTALFGSFAVVGLLLAAFGIYGVMSFVVAQRTHEIGLRMALGANRRDILLRVIREGMITAGAGTIAGTGGAFYVAKMMRGIVPDVGGLDSMAYVLVTATLLTTALIACVVPAVRAATVDPMVALRQD